MLDSSPQSPSTFEKDVRLAFQRLRGSITAALAAIDADPEQSRELSRRLGVNKNLAWRVSKIVAAREPHEAVPHVPGPAALATLLKALRRAGAPSSAIDAVSDAMEAYDRMVAVHSGDRATLEQLIAGLARTPAGIERLEQSRRQAFVGMGSTWGVQAQAQFSTHIIGPSHVDPTAIDSVSLRGLIGLRRMRSDVRWTLFRTALRTGAGDPLDVAPAEPLDEGVGTDGLPCLRDYWSPGMEPLETVTGADGMRYVLPAGPVGRSAAVTCAFGEIYRSSLPPRRTKDTRLARMGCALITPVERVQVDMIVSDELPWAHDPKAELYAQLDGAWAMSQDDRATNRLPLLEQVHDLGRGADLMASPDVPGYTDLLQRAFERVGWDGSGFHGFRFTMRYPPIPTALYLVSELPESD